MLAQIRPRSYHEYLALPIFGPILDGFTDWLKKRGYTLGTITNQLKDCRKISAFCLALGVQTLEELTADHLDKAKAHFRQRWPACAGAVRQLQFFLIEQHGLIPAMSETLPMTPTALIVQSYEHHLVDTKGLQPSTVRAHSAYIARFLEFVGVNGASSLATLRLADVDRFVAHCSTTLNRYSLQHVVAYLRAFLRFEHGRGNLPNPLHELIDSPRLYRLEKLPHVLPWTTVTKLLDVIDRTTAQGARNYAMLLLCATYGLRACEIVALRLEDIHWRQGQLIIHQSKTDNPLVLPLNDTVANALIDYLKNFRPTQAMRQLFLRIRAPHGALKPTAFADVFGWAIRRSGLDLPYRNAHCLRHSYAVHLLRQGVSVKGIGDVLGHRDQESTCVYLRLAVDDLRKVALELPPCSSKVPIEITNDVLQGIPRIRLVKAKGAPLPEGGLAKAVNGFLAHHHALGKAYLREERVLSNFAVFVMNWGIDSIGQLTGECFNQWSESLDHLAPVERRNRMRIVRNFCLYHRRIGSVGHIPDLLTFPLGSSQFCPHILSADDIACILAAAKQLPARGNSPLRPEVVHLAVTLLFTAGLRRGELLRLTLDDIDQVESVLAIRATKFHKSRLVALSQSAVQVLQDFLALRAARGGPMAGESPLIWPTFKDNKGKFYSGTSLRRNWRLLCASQGILSANKLPPRLHDLRHSFAVNSLLHSYETGADLLAQLPRLSTYMGHVSIASTQHYLHFIEPLRDVVSQRFEDQYGSLITAQSGEGGS